MMKQIFLAGMLILGMLPVLSGQKYYSKVARISFSSEASLEKIEATNSNGLIVLDAASGRLECSVLIKGFQFSKALMQEHFNENYMESHLYPKGIFKGTVTNIRDISLGKDGSYTASIKGELTMHGVTKEILTSGKVIVKAGKITVAGSFDILVADYNIKVPKVVQDNIAEKVKVTVNADLLLME
jgi:hypothetical protein